LTVLDASIVVRILEHRRADGALRERFARDPALHAPALLDAEVVSAVRGLVLTSKIDSRITFARAERMLVRYGELPVQRHPMQPLQGRVLRLRHNLTAYDAFYVALAETLGMPLLTDDAKFAKAAGHSAVVETWS
jgi:predicted nucleic acid-binding protein